MFCQNSDYISIVISLGALGLSLFTFLSERVRLRKEATLHAYLKIQTETIKRLKEVDKGENSFINLDKSSDKENWDKVTLSLAEIENFAVGINTNIYNIYVLNRLGGSNIIEWYRTLKPVIFKKRGVSTNGEHYNEFENMIRSLERLRGSKS